MYGILLIRLRGQPELVTVAHSRCDFLGALNLRDSVRKWNRAVSDFRVAREVSDFRDGRIALDEVRRTCP